MALINGVEIAYSDAGDGPAVIFLHETGATSASWSEVIGEMTPGFRSIVYDRRGWGRSTAPEQYSRTTVTEQSQDAIKLLDHLEVDAAVVCGAGIGAVAAIDLALREPGRTVEALAVEPPLLALVAKATEGLSADVARVRKAAEDHGPAAAVDAYLGAELNHLGPEAGRLAARETAGGGDGLEARRHPGSLFAEITAVPAWPLPLAELADAETGIQLITGSTTPPVLLEATRALAARVASLSHRELEGDPLSGGALAELIRRAAQPAEDPDTDSPTTSP